MKKNGKQNKLGMSFSVIHHRGEANSATTFDNHVVTRQDVIYFENHGLVKCAPYDNHFVYDDPQARKIKYRWTPMCTCGSPAGIVGYNAYKGDASPEAGSSIPGELVVCLSHAQFGKHADGSK